MNRVPILIYHAIDADNDKVIVKDNGELLYVVRLEEFERQMKYLSDNGYHVVSLDDYVAFVMRYQDNAKSLPLCSSLQFLIEVPRNGIPRIGTLMSTRATTENKGQMHPDLPEKSVIITFDDGHLSNYTRAFPILQKYGFAATFFVTVKNIGSYDGVRYEQLREMADSGISIQSHTMTHPFLSDLDAKQIHWELAESKSALELALGNPVNHLALPGGRYNSTVRNTAMEVGYQTVCTSNIGINTLTSDLYALRRLAIKRDTSFSTFCSIVEMKPLTVMRYKAKYSLLNGLKKTLGNKRYIAMREKLLHRTKANKGYE